MIIDYIDEHGYMSEDELCKLEKAADVVASQELGEATDVSEIEVSLTIVNDVEIREINREYRNVDETTDVLSFPQYNDREELIAVLKGLKCDDAPSVMLGDVVLCYDKVVKQAYEYGNSIDREMVYLFVHSMHHLFGYDHIEEDERKLMREHEEVAMEIMGLGR